MMNRHERRNRIANRLARMNGLMDYQPERIPILVAVQPQKPDGTPLLVVNETRIGSTVVRRHLVPLTAFVGLIADAIASERARASAPASSPSTSVAAPTPSTGRNGTTRKPNGHARIATMLEPSLEIEHPAHQSVSAGLNRPYSPHEEEHDDRAATKSWKRYRAKQWRTDSGNRWSCRREASASAWSIEI